VGPARGGGPVLAFHIAHALRDVLPAGADPASAPPAVEFLAGYRSVRDLSDVDIGRPPLFAAAHARRQREIILAWSARTP
jgi:hypothetical protein